MFHAELSIRIGLPVSERIKALTATLAAQRAKRRELQTREEVVVKRAIGKNRRFKAHPKFKYKEEAKPVSELQCIVEFVIGAQM